MSEGVQETFVSHLVELRDRLIKALIAFAIVFAILMIWPGAGAIYDFLAAPLTRALPEGTKMIATGVITPFMVPLKVGAMVAFVVALPVILYQAWAFVAPGLYTHEKKFALPLVIASSILFIVGMAFCYYFVFGKVFSFINDFAPKSITPAPDIEAYLNFVLTMFVAWGVTFEVPIVVIVLVAFNIVSLEKLREWRSYVIVGAFVIAAVVTPPDVLSQLLLAIPMCILYEVALLCARFVSKPQTRAEADAAEADKATETDPAGGTGKAGSR